MIQLNVQRAQDVPRPVSCSGSWISSCLHTHTHTHTHTHMYTNMNLFFYGAISEDQVHKHIHTRTHVQTLHTRLHSMTCARSLMHTYMHTWFFALSLTTTHIHTRTQANTQTHIHIHSYTQTQVRTAPPFLLPIPLQSLQPHLVVRGGLLF